MVRDRRRRLGAATRLAADVVAIFVAFAISFTAYWWAVESGILQRSLPDPALYLRLVVLFEAISVMIFWERGLYRPRESVLNLWEISAALKGVLVSAAFFFAVIFVLDIEWASRIVVVGWMVLAAALVPLERRILSALFVMRRLRGGQGDAVLIVGGGEAGRLLLKKIATSPHTGRIVAGFLDDGLPVGTEIVCTVDQSTGRRYVTSVVGRTGDLERVARLHSVREILIDPSSLEGGVLDSLVRQVDGLGLRFGIVPHIAHLRPDHLLPEDLGAIPVLRPVGPSEERWYLVAKRMMDIVLSVVLLLVTAPIWVVAAVAIKLDSRGPVLFWQERVGLGGRTFSLYKFRTMHVESDRYALSPVRERDPRITRVGRILRRGGLDEIPQLLNVIRGEMSLVGPRPEMPFIVEQYSDLQGRRLDAKPGITGLWQVSPDRHHQIHENMEYDLYYLNRRSIGLDFAILLETLMFTLGLVFRVHSSAAEVPATSAGSVLIATAPSPSPLGERRPTPASLSLASPGGSDLVPPGPAAGIDPRAEQSGALLP